MPSDDSADALAIANLVADSHHLLDTGRWSELTTLVFADEAEGVVPEAGFGFATWRGRQGLDEGYAASMARFSAAVHVVSNLHVRIDGDTAVARSYVQGWHWIRERDDEGADRTADFLVLGEMTDECVRQSAGWRIARRTLRRMGPGVAYGRLPAWLAGLGE
jgi:hypothetical protein